MYECDAHLIEINYILQIIKLACSACLKDSKADFQYSYDLVVIH